MSNATFTLRVDSALKDAFTKIAKLQDRTGAQLVREFMRDVVKNANQQQEYDAWFAEQVAVGRADVAQGRIVSNTQVTQEAEARRQHLLSMSGKNQ